MRAPLLSPPPPPNFCHALPPRRRGHLLLRGRRRPAGFGRRAGQGQGGGGQFLEGQVGRHVWGGLCVCGRARGGGGGREEDGSVRVRRGTARGPRLCDVPPPSLHLLFRHTCAAHLSTLFVASHPRRALLAGQPLLLLLLQLSHRKNMVRPLKKKQGVRGG